MMDLLGLIVEYETEEEYTEETPPYNLQLLPGGSPVPDEMPEETPIMPRVGEEYQVEIPDLKPEIIPADNKFLIGLPVPLTWVDTQENEGPIPVLGIGTSHWSETEVNGLILGLYIFGKNLILVQQFIESKSIGHVMTYYYGVFYKSEAYKKWFDCRKARTRKCIVGTRIFTGARQQELVSRLLSAAPQEKHEPVLEAIKSFNENTSSFENFVFFLRSIIGLQTFIDVVAIGKGHEDLTGPGPDLSRAAHPAPARSEIPSGKACSSLSPPEIIKFLTGDFRVSKARSNDLFWEAVWPRLLARGWHSEQPRDLIGSKNSLVFLMPGINKFSRRRLMKGEHYYDCISDVLKMVAAEPEMLEIDSVMASNVDGECGPGTMSVNPKEYLRPKVRSHDVSDLMRFMVVDTSMLHDGKKIRVRELKSLPADMDLGKEPGLMAGQSRAAVPSDSSDSEDDKKSRVRRRDLGSGKASDVNPVQTSTPAVESIDLGSSLNIDAVSNGHVETNSVANDGAGQFGKFYQSSKPRAHKYLSPVPKRRRLSGCKQQRDNQKSLAFSKGSSNEARHNRSSVLSEDAVMGRQGDHPQRKRKVKFLVKDVMREELEPDLCISRMIETVDGGTTVESVSFDKLKEARASTSQRKKKFRDPNVAQSEPNRGVELAAYQTKIESHSSVQVTEAVKEAVPTKRRRKVTVLFKEAPQSDNNAILNLVNGSETGANLTQHDSCVSKKPKKVVRRKPKPSTKEAMKEIELPSLAATVSEVRQHEAKEIEITTPQFVKQEPWDCNLNEPEMGPTYVGTSSSKSIAPESSELNASTSGRWVSRRNRPPTIRALEAVANGFLGGPKKRTVSASSRRARKSGETSRRSHKVEETAGPVPSEDGNAGVLSVMVRDELSMGGGDQPIVDLTGDIQPSAKALDHAVKMDWST